MFVGLAMSRRRMLAVGGLVLLGVLAGCSAAGSLSMERVTDEELAKQASRSIDADETELTDKRRLVQRAIENGSATARGQSPPVEAGLPFDHEGRYYDLSWTVTDRDPGTAVQIAVDYNGTVSDAETVAYENLSAHDRSVLDGLLPPRGDRRIEGYDFGAGVTYDATEENRSVLLADEPSAVSYEGETYPIDVRNPEPITIRTYQYTSIVVANDTSAYARQLRESYLFSLSGLSQDERAVVEEAVDSSYYAESNNDETFQSILDRFRGHEPLEVNEYRGTWLVRYDGDIYLADLSYEGFDLDLNTARSGSGSELPAAI